MAMLSGRRSLGFKPQNRSLSQFRAFTCFVLADCVVGLIEIEFLLLTIISVTSENSSGIAIANGVDGNACQEGSHWSPDLRFGCRASYVHSLALYSPIASLALLKSLSVVHNICNFRELVDVKSWLGFF